MSRLLQELLSTGECEWIDFKESHHNNPAKLLHDIICLANAHHDGDRYLVFGVNDHRVPVGLADDALRRTLADVNSLLAAQNFNDTPKLEATTFTTDAGCLIDCFIIKHTKRRPYFLQRDYRRDKVTVRAGVPYSRNADANTPIDGAPSDAQLEEMFRERLGLNLPASERLRFLLRRPRDWNYREDSDGNALYSHKIEPSFRIRSLPYERSDSFRDPWTAEFLHHDARRYQHLALYNETELETFYVIRCDSGRFTTVMPEQKSWNVDSDKFFLTYWFIEGSFNDLANRLVQTHNPDWGKLSPTVRFPVLESGNELDEDYRSGMIRFVYYRVTRPANCIYRIENGQERKIADDR